MGKKVTKVSNEAGKILFDCPGCGMAHGLNVDRSKKPCWDFNGNFEKPTFTPSVLTTYPYGEDQKKVVCHSFITDGKIRFLHDCTHKLKGQTVDLPDWD